MTTYTMGAYPGCVQTSSSTVTAASTCTPPPVCPLLPPDTPPGSCPSGYTGTPAHTVTTGQNPTTCAAITTTVASTCTPTPVTTHCDAMGAGWSGNGFIISVGGTITSGGGTCSSTALCQVGQTGGPIVTTYDVVSGGYSKSGVCQPELCPPADPPKTVPSSCPAGWSGSGAITTITYTRGAYPGCVQTDDGGKETTASTCMPPKCANGASDYPTCTPPTCANGATDYPTCTPPTCANGGTNYPTCTPPPVITTLTCADYGLTGSGFITSTNGVVTSAGGTCSSTVYCAANETGGPIVTTINVAAGTSSTTGAACQVKMANCPGGSTIIDTNPIMAPGSKICRFSWPAISNGSWANGSCSGQGVWMICSPGTYSCSNGSLNILVPESCIDQTGGL